MISTLLEILQKGGPFIGVILATSVVGGIIVVEKMLYLLYLKKLNVNFMMKEILVNVEGGDFPRALRVCRSNSWHPLAVVLSSALMRADRSYREIFRSAEEALSKVTPRIQKHTNYLSMIANIATLLGLLGTILGLITCFESVGAAAAAQKQRLLSEGISHAMFTTACGLIVAIPMLIFHQVISNMQDGIIETIDQNAQRVINRIDFINRRNHEALHVEGNSEWNSNSTKTIRSFTENNTGGDGTRKLRPVSGKDTLPVDLDYGRYKKTG